MLLAALLLGLAASPDASHVRGMTISCQTWGQEWGTDGFGVELDELAALGVNWVAIHPYARIHADGTVGPLRAGAFDPDDPPPWITRPIREAHARGMSILVIPHLAHWGSPFSHRGAIAFEDEASWARFFASYEAWIAAVAAAAADADAFCVGSELGGTSHREAAWRRTIETVRGATGARLVYSANWDEFERVAFWDALDAVGVQAYFPLAEEDDPDVASLRAGWARVLPRLRAVHARTGKPVVFTELGYDRTPHAARRPWEGTRGRTAAQGDGALQERCYAAALEALAPERAWLRGAFVWKWFVGEARANFPADTPGVRAVLGRAWGADGTSTGATVPGR